MTVNCQRPIIKLSDEAQTRNAPGTMIWKIDEKFASEPMAQS